ncbi:MAG: N-acetyltransferase [Rhodospirillaceae bacterium]|nr:N-acetyltransferase [Rhodospirillaceae bacterium]MBL6942358.1 N-acetyltransferase [Rhodospirillales bacterium]
MIREENAADIPAIKNVVLAAFGQTEEAGLVDALRQSGDTALSLVAEEDGEITGHILFSILQAPEGYLALAPVCVTPTRQNKGIGSELIIEGLAKAKHDGWQGVFVLGEPNYYQRFGFSVEMADRFETPYPKPYFMALELVPDALAQRSGEIIYAAPFLALG